MRAITSLRVFKLGAINYWRNRGLSLSATLVLALTLFIVLIFFLLNNILSIASAEIRNKIDEIVITFPDSVTEGQIQDLEAQLAARSDVKNVTFVSKEEAIQRFQSYRIFSEQTRQIPTAENNPLPRSLEITAQDPRQLADISAFLSESPRAELIHNNTYSRNGEVTQRLSKFERGVTIGGIALTVVFVIISLVVVLSTIRLAIFARREEIEIMRLVGANNIFITVPFVVEGCLYAIIAAIVALGGGWFAIQRLSQSLDTFFAGILPVNLVNLFVLRFPFILGIELALGLGIAIFGSLISIQRYLKR